MYDTAVGVMLKMFFSHVIMCKHLFCNDLWPTIFILCVLICCLL